MSDEPSKTIEILNCHNIYNGKHLAKTKGVFTHDTLHKHSTTQHNTNTSLHTTAGLTYFTLMMLLPNYAHCTIHNTR